jgi:hypothetical protein
MPLEKAAAFFHFFVSAKAGRLMVVAALLRISVLHKKPWSLHGAPFQTIPWTRLTEHRAIVKQMLPSEDD